jgi:hypothetical protein
MDFFPLIGFISWIVYWILTAPPLVKATIILSAALTYLIISRGFKVKNLVLNLTITIICSLTITLYLISMGDGFFVFWDLLIIYSIAFLPIILVPILIYLSIKHKYNLEKRFCMFFTLIASLAFAVAIPYLTEQIFYCFESTFHQAGFNSPVLPWSDCSSVATDGCPCSVTALCGCRHMSYIVCNYVKLYELVLIGMATVLILVSSAYNALKNN